MSYKEKNYHHSFQQQPSYVRQQSSDEEWQEQVSLLAGHKFTSSGSAHSLTSLPLMKDAEENRNKTKELPFLDDITGERELFLAGSQAMDLKNTHSLRTPLTPTLQNDLYWLKQLLKINSAFLVIEFLIAYQTGSTKLLADSRAALMTVMVSAISCGFEYLKIWKQNRANTVDFFGSLPALGYITYCLTSNFLLAQRRISRNELHQFEIDGAAMFLYISVFSLSNLQMIRAYYAQEHRSFGTVYTYIYPYRCMQKQSGSRLLYSRNEFGKQECRLIISLAWLIIFSDVTRCMCHCALWLGLLCGATNLQSIGHYIIIGHAIFIALSAVSILIDQLYTLNSGMSCRRAICYYTCGLFHFFSPHRQTDMDMLLRIDMLSNNNRRNMMY